MNHVSEWLTRERVRIQSLPRLDDALLGIAPSRYAWHRLRYVWLRALLRTALRLFELALFASVIPFELLGSVFVIRSCLLLTEGLWWGGLEPLRNDVRQLTAQGRTGQASVLIRQWLMLTCVAGFAGIVAAALWIGFGPSAYRSFSVIDAYLLGCALRWAFDLWTTTYQAGVNGARRVYRPLWSLVLVDLADVVLLGLAFWWAGAWGLGVSLALVGGLRALISCTFTRRVYRQLKLELGGAKAWLSAWQKARWSFRRSAQFAVANVIGELDALLVLGLIAAPGNPRDALLLAALFHVLMPLQSVASAAPRLFYLDFKRLQAWGSPLLLQRFDAFLDRAMWWTPLPIGAVTLAVLAAFWRGNYGWLAVGLFCFAAIRSRLSLAHVRAYSLGDHSHLTRLLWAMLGVAAAAPVAAHLAAPMALAVVVVLAAVGLWLVGRSVHGVTARPVHGPVGTSAWVHHLLRSAAPVQLGLARVDRRLMTFGRLEHAWRPCLSEAVTSRLSHDTLIWFSTSVADAKTLTTAASGAVRELRLTPLFDNGMAALLHGVPSPVWQRHFAFVNSAAGSFPSDSGATLEELSEQLSTIHPEIRVTALSTEAPLAQLAEPLRSELRRLLLDAARGHVSFTTLGTLDVAVFAPEGAPRALLSAPVAARPSTPGWRSELLSRLQRAEIETALARAQAGRCEKP